MPHVVYFNGSYVPKEEARISPDDRGFLFADGVYEVVRSYGGNLFELDAHMARLAAGLAALEINGANVQALRPVFDRLIDMNRLAAGEAVVYMQVTRGAAPRIHAFPDPPVAPTVYAEAKPFVPKGDPARGVSVITVPDTRWARCDIKTVNLVANCLANERARRAGALEAVFVRDGVALEATASSLFAVLSGEVRTAPRSNYILPSISRGVILQMCADAGIPARETPVFENELALVDEVFLAGTTLEVMPVVQVDGKPVGDGHPGPLARRLGMMFRARTETQRAP